MNYSAWFHDQLQASADGFVWGALQVPEAHRNVRPPGELGEWTAARHLFHMVFYEKMYALPRMRTWLGEPLPPEDFDEETAWGAGSQDYEGLLAEFRKVREQEIQLLARFDEPIWNTTLETAWGPVDLSWVVSKTYQHTAEHTSDILRIALFWDWWPE